MDLKQKTFLAYPDPASSDEQYLIVDVAGRGRVVIKKEGEGLVVEVCPFHAEEDVASLMVTNAELCPDPNEPQQETN